MIAKRPKLEMASRNRSSRFPARSAVSADRPVTFPPGRARLATKPIPTGSPTAANTIGTIGAALLCRHYGWGSPRDDDVDFEPGKLGRDLGQALAAPVCPAIFDCDRAALDPTEVVEPPRECGRPLTFRQRCAVAQEPDNWSLRRLLRVPRERQCRRRAAEQPDERAALHSKISSARPDSGSGMVMPSARAVFKLMNISTLLACCTGRSAGLPPLRIRPA